VELAKCIVTIRRGVMEVDEWNGLTELSLVEWGLLEDLVEWGLVDDLVK